MLYYFSLLKFFNITFRSNFLTFEHHLFSVKKKKTDVEVADSLESLFNSESSNKSKFPTPPSNSKVNSSNISLSSDFDGLFHDETSKDANNSVETSPASDASEPQVEQRFGAIMEDLVDKDGFVHCPRGLKQLFLTQTVYEDILLVAKGINEISKAKFGENAEKLEVYMYLFAEPDEIPQDKPARVSSIYIPIHRAAETNVNVDQDGILDLQRYIRQTDKVLLGWAHSHGHFEVYSSETDNINHQIILNETNNFYHQGKFRLKYMYSLTVVETGEHYGVTLTQYPCGHIEQSEAEIQLEGEGYNAIDHEKRYAEIKKLLQERVSVVQPSQSKTIDDNLTDLTEELLADFVRQLWKAKNMMMTDLNEEQESLLTQLQFFLQKYDKLLISGAEESFRGISKKLLELIKNSKNKM